MKIHLLFLCIYLSTSLYPQSTFDPDKYLAKYDTSNAPKHITNSQEAFSTDSIIDESNKMTKNWKARNNAMFRAEKYINISEFSNAIIEIDKIIDFGRHDSYIFFLKGLCSYYLEKYEDAIIFLTKAENEKKADKMGYYEYQNWAYSENEISPISISLEYKYSHIYLIRAEAKGAIEDYYGALKDINIYLNYKKDPHAYGDRGTYKAHLGEIKEAKADLLTAISMGQKTKTIYINLGICYGMSGNNNKACVCFDKATEMGSIEAIQLIKDHCNSWLQLNKVK